MACRLTRSVLGSAGVPQQSRQWPVQAAGHWAARSFTISVPYQSQSDGNPAVPTPRRRLESLSQLSHSRSWSLGSPLPTVSHCLALSWPVVSGYRLVASDIPVHRPRVPGPRPPVRPPPPGPKPHTTPISTAGARSNFQGSLLFPSLLAPVLRTPTLPQLDLHTSASSVLSIAPVPDDLLLCSLYDDCTTPRYSVPLCQLSPSPSDLSATWTHGIAPRSSARPNTPTLSLRTRTMSPAIVVPSRLR